MRCHGIGIRKHLTNLLSPGDLSITSLSWLDQNLASSSFLIPKLSMFQFPLLRYGNLSGSFLAPFSPRVSSPLMAQLKSFPFCCFSVPTYSRIDGWSLCTSSMSPGTEVVVRLGTMNSHEGTRRCRLIIYPKTLWWGVCFMTRRLNPVRRGLYGSDAVLLGQDNRSPLMSRLVPEG